jgi:chromosome segregation ATPase
MNRLSQHRLSLARLTGTRRLPALAVAAGLAIATSLQAQDAPPAQGIPKPHSTQPAMTPEQSRQMKEIQDVHAEYEKLQKHLAQIQRDTLQAHPELQKQEQDFRDLIMDKMNGNGQNVKEEMAEINKIEEKLRSSDTPESERSALMSDYQKKTQALRNAQTQAMKNPDVQAAGKKLIENIVTVMKKEDPQTEQLMQQIQEKRQQLSQMLGAAGHTP